jgi:sporulation protein YlmC with PRC-barrel domain
MNRSVIHKVETGLICTALLLGAAAFSPQAIGQQSKAPSQAASKPSAPAKPADPVAGVIPLGVTVIETDIITPGMRASKLIHQDVYNDKGQKIGKIGDLVISPDGALSVAVIDVGGFLGVAKHRVAIPVKQFTQIAPKVVLPGADKDALKALPEFVPA